MTGAPGFAAVVGWPIGHSRSPRLHGHWLRRYAIPGHYLPFALPPQRFPDGLRAMATLGFRGTNVTLPHKEAALDGAVEATETARLIGAANTLTFRADGSYAADNTDAYGFLANLRQVEPGWSAAAGPALVIGAGGAARAVVAALLSAGAPEVRIANRTRARSDALRRHFGPTVRPVDWAEAASAVAGALTIVNATSMGMRGEPALQVDLGAATPGAVVADIVYEPLETPFLTQASTLGLTTVDGLGMLLHQAVPGFEAWFGRRPEVDADLRAAVLAP